MPYVINPIGFVRNGQSIDIDETQGYDAWEYFDGDAMKYFSTADGAGKWATAHYKGPDKDGIGLEWEIVEF